MDRKTSILNIGVSLLFRLLTMIAGVAVTQAVISCYGNAVNGLNSLYTSILGFLSVAELGIGSAITFCMYRPIVEENTRQVSALYHLFQRCYNVVGCVILACGLVLTPFVRFFARDYKLLDVNIHTSFVLMLIPTVLTYFYGAKTALIGAYKRNFITTIIGSGGLLLQYLLQLVIIRSVGSFSVCLLCRTAAVLVQWVVTEWFVRRFHADIISVKAALEEEILREVIEKIRAMFMHKIGQLLVNTVDSVVISVFLGVAVLGVYSNYVVIQSAMDGLIRLVFTSLVSVLGHLYAEKSRKVTMQYCETFQLLNFALGAVFYLGYYAVIDDLIAILFGEQLVAERSVSLVIALNGFVQFLRCNVVVFRDATGTFYHDRWKPLAEGALNLILSVILIRQVGIVGVIGATIFTSLTICHIVEPYVLYRYAFSASPRRHYVRNLEMLLLFVLALFLYERIDQSVTGHWEGLIVNGMLSVAVSTVICGCAALLNRDILKTIKE